MAKKPVIGITLDFADGSNPKYSYSTKPWYALRKGYAECVREHGGLPILIPYDVEIDDILQVVDAIIIPGGDEDINPKFYGATTIHPKVKVNDQRAMFEMALVKAAMRQNMPILGICNGLQVLNVVCGGSLFQHIPDECPSEINHEQPAPKDAPTHKVEIVANTKLAELAGSESEIMVNSTHHQAVKKLGTDLVASARATDGIIEAIESTKHEFVVAVEWHPEYKNSNLDQFLFKALVKEATKYQER